MIFVSFGNAPANQSFTRMAEAIDKLGKETEERVLVQTGNTLYDFHHVDTVKFLEHQEMLNIMKEASIVILQGGWGTISEAIMLGKRIKELRKQNHLTQSELGSKLGVIKQTVSSWENGVSSPNNDTLANIASIFGVTTDYLLGNDASTTKQLIECRDISNRISKLAAHSRKNIEDLKPLLKTEILSGYYTDSSLFRSDIYTIADFYGVSDEYIIGGPEFEEQTYGNPLDEIAQKFLNVFLELNEDNRDIIIGDMKKLLKEQRREEALPTKMIHKQAK